MTTKELVQVAQWIDKGVCELFTINGWKSFPNSQFFTIDVEADFSFYRHKPAQPKLRPWRPEEVPVGALIKNEHLTSMIVGAHTNEDIYVGHVDHLFNCRTFGSNWQHSTDHGKTWLPCGILE